MRSQTLLALALLPLAAPLGPTTTRVSKATLVHDEHQHEHEHAPEGGDASFEITQALLDDAIAVARPAVERALGYAIPEGFAGARVGEVDEIAKVLARENLASMTAQIGDEEIGAEQAEAFGAGLAPALLAKYAFEERVILVSPEGFERNAEMLAVPELLSEQALRAVIVHELVHAADVPRFAFAATLAGLDDPDRINALSAVLEGHAQHVARKVCAELGLEAGFRHYNQAVVGVPTDEGDDGEAIRLMRRVARLTLARTYTDGERFVAAIEKAGGPEGVERAFREPPRDLAEVGTPEWYLHPELRPVAAYDLDAALTAFEAGYGDEFAGVRQSIHAAQLELAFESLDPQVVKRITSSLRGARYAQRARGQEVLHYAMACEWSSDEAAELVLQASVELVKQRDEQMKDGMIRIESSEYEDVAFEDLHTHGTLATKQMKTPFAKFVVRSLVLRSGSLTFELLRSNEAGTADEFLAAARKIVAAAQAPAPAEAPPTEGDEKAPPADGTSGGGGG